MKILVCGGRDYSDRKRVYQILDAVHAKFTITELIHGAARGADSLGGEWARERGIPEKAYPAQWDKHGRGAGPIRNQQMLDEGKPDGVVAFPGGNGTADMIRRSKAAGLKVYEPG